MTERKSMSQEKKEEENWTALEIELYINTKTMLKRAKKNE